jgi:glycerophosphoryl diester phosphodiesterase
MLIIGHRGAAGLAPENTMAAIAAGIEAGSDMIEIDVRLTRDNQLVVIHDPRLVRTPHPLNPALTIS